MCLLLGSVQAQIAKYAGLGAGRSKTAIVKCDKVEVGQELRWKLTDVIGEEDGLGIECLSGSGAIARSAVFLSICLFVWLSVRLSVCLSVYSCSGLSTCLFL